MAMDGMTEKQKQKHDCYYLPYNMIEQEILSRLPVKSLLRLRLVCKQWKTTISDDPRFADAHLRQSRNSPRMRLITIPMKPGWVSPAAELVDVSEKQFRVISTVDYPPSISPGVLLLLLLLCHCDGLFLLQGSRLNEFILWNPSNRSYKSLIYPYLLNYETGNRFGICSDQLVMNNYKVVIVGEKGTYAVYNCKSKCWSERRETLFFSFSKYGFCEWGGCFNGSIYWAVTDDDDGWRVVCFDGRDEEWKNINVGKFEHRIMIKFEVEGIISSTEALYVFLFNDASGHRQTMKLEVDGDCHRDVWAEVEVKALPPGDSRIISWIHKDEFLLYLLLEDEGLFVLYDVATQSVVKWFNDETSRHLRHRRMLPYMENLISLFQC